MALPSSGALSLSDIQTEFGGSNPISLSEYYGVDTGVPASGTIAISDFYGTSASSAVTVTIREDQVTNNSTTALRVGYQASNGGDFNYPESTNTGGFNLAFGGIGSTSLITGGNITGITIANYSGTTVGNQKVVIISTDRTTDGGWSSVNLTGSHPPFFGNVSFNLSRTSADGFLVHSRLLSVTGVTRYKWVYIFNVPSTYDPINAIYSAWLYQAQNSGSGTVTFS